MLFSAAKLRDIQDKFARDVVLEDAISLDKVKKIAGFDVAVHGKQLICGVAVLSYPKLELVEKRVLVKKEPMPYIPTLLAFREGPLILESYYNLESEPDVIMVDGHGIAHPFKAGLACYVGVELAKPTIGVAKSLLVGEQKDGDIVFEGEVVGKAVKTREFARPVFVSPGNMISIETAAELVKKCIQPPHKLPEPIHLAHRLADAKREELVSGKK
jgi:deoxyribonuclease V